MGANTHNNYFSSKGGGSSLTSADSYFTGHPEAIAEGSQKVNEMLKQVQHDRNFGSLCKVRNDKYVSKAHSKHKPHATHAKRVAFTLAEVLITLTIIGIVAAMTIPTLVANYQTRAWSTSASVFERKLEEALRQMNTQQVLAGYKSTADFVNVLGKYFKINKVCNNNELTSCFTDKITWEIIDITNESESEIIDSSTFKTAADLGQNDWDSETIGVQFANGTTGIISYNPHCRENPYTNQFTGTSCISLIYDTNGHKNPNAFNKDIRGINSLLGSCAFKMDSTCFSAPFKPEPITKAECETLKNELGIKECHFEADYWAGAIKTCGGINKITTGIHLNEISHYIDYPTLGYSNMEKIGFKDLQNTEFRIWSSTERNGYMAGSVLYCRPTGCYFQEAGRQLSSNYYAICVNE